MKVLLAFLLAMTGAAEVAEAADTMKCQKGLVSTGDSRIDLLSKCGEPDMKNSYAEEVTQYSEAFKKKALITVEDWTYNFGPNQFMRIVTLRNGTISAIHSGNYGFVKGSNVKKRECTEQVVRVGDTNAEVLNKCGEPASKDSYQEEVTGGVKDLVKKSVYVNVEKWTYNLGPNMFMRILTFRNGKLAEIKSGGKGY